jgi:sugar phosphate isomerase/epimerase
MHVAVHSQTYDADVLIARCQSLEVRDVCLGLAEVPGYKATGVPECAALSVLVGRLSGAGIRVPVAIAWFGNDPDLVLNPGAHRPEIDAKRRTLDVLGQVGIGALLHYVDLADSANPDDDARYWEGLTTVFRELVATAEANDVHVANHAIWRCLPDTLREDAVREGVTLADYRAYRRPTWGGPYLLTGGQHLKRLIDAVPSDHNGVCFCTGMSIMGGDVPSLVDTFKGKIFYAQMRDLRGRWPAAEEVFLGEGELDFAQILGLLHAAGYTGTVGPEHLGRVRFPGEDLEAAATRFAQRMLAAIQSEDREGRRP